MNMLDYEITLKTEENGKEVLTSLTSMPMVIPNTEDAGKLKQSCC